MAVLIAATLFELPTLCAQRGSNPPVPTTLSIDYESKAIWALKCLWKHFNDVAVIGGKRFAYSRNLKPISLAFLNPVENIGVVKLALEDV
jgi:hypothetical protein